jgi:hypothetical protein
MHALLPTIIRCLLHVNTSCLMGMSMTGMPGNMASDELTAQFRMVEPSTNQDGHVVRPCALTLRDGRVAERVACIEQAHGLPDPVWIAPEDIREVRESPYRLPAAMANQLYSLTGERGVLYYTLLLSEQPDLACVAIGEPLVDFPALPPNVHTTDIRDIVVGTITESSQHPAEGQHYTTAPYEVCYYVPADAAPYPM